jgi:trigger factor
MTPATRNAIGPVTRRPSRRWSAAERTGPDAIVAAPMADAVRTTVTELPDSRVRVEAEVASEEVQRRLEQAASALGREMRVPGFRRGKVPPPVVIRRVGREAVLDEAVRESLVGWYSDAIDSAGIVPVGDPKVDVGDLPGPREPLTFSIEIGVRPVAQLGQYKGLEVGRREPEINEADVAAEVEQLRDRLARLETAERPAQKGDFVVIDYRGEVDGEPFEGGEGRDQLVELGSARLIPGFEEQLVGARAGDEREVRITFPDDYGAGAPGDAPSDLAGKEATFHVIAHEVKEKLLPPVDDDLASDAAGIDTLGELEDDIRRRLREADERAVADEFRDAVLDAAVAEAKLEVPEELVHARAHEVWEQTLRALARQGISREAYLRIAGRDEEAIVHEAMPEAEKALRREAVLAAVVEAEGIEPSEDELLEALGDSAERESTTPEKLLARLRSANRNDALERDLAIRRAAELLAEEAQPISVEQAKARQKLWTPGREREEGQSAGGQLWTPGS